MLKNRNLLTGITKQSKIELVFSKNPILKYQLNHKFSLVN